MKAEYPKKRNCPRKDSAEHEEYVGVQSAGNREVGEQDGADLLERILSRDNLNRAYKRVRANKGAPGIDGMTIEDALPWLREHREELLENIRQGKYKPQPVRRKEIPKPDGGISAQRADAEDQGKGGQQKSRSADREKQGETNIFFRQISAQRTDAENHTARWNRLELWRG